MYESTCGGSVEYCYPGNWKCTKCKLWMTTSALQNGKCPGRGVNDKNMCQCQRCTSQCTSQKGPENV